jgi:hypothetical protein
MADRNRHDTPNDAERELATRLGDDWRAGLDRVLATQTELYGQLDGLCGRQREMVESGDVDRLSGLLGERSKIVERIAEVSASFTPFSELWGDVELALGEEELRDIRRRIEAIAAMASSIAERDAADGESMRARRDELADRLAGNTKSRVAASAYAGPRPSGPRFQDREG